MTSFTLSRNWILGGYSSEYVTEGTFAPGVLGDLVDGLLRRVLPMMERDGSPGALWDIKGRNPQDILLPGGPVAEKDEVFRLIGECGVETVENERGLESFDICGYSPFDRFEGSHHIVHSIKTERHGALPPWLPISALGRAAPIRPRYFRFSAEHFTSTRLFATLGYSPAVTDSFLLDCAGDRFVIKLTVESRTLATHDPFERLDFLAAAAHVVLSCCNLDIREDYATRLGAHR